MEAWDEVEAVRLTSRFAKNRQLLVVTVAKSSMLAHSVLMCVFTLSHSRIAMNHTGTRKQYCP